MRGYFDWAATTPPNDSIICEALAVSNEFFANPSSVHSAGISARLKLTEARNRCAKALGVGADTLYFTSGGTESNHIPILSLLQRPSCGSIVISAIEHPSVSAQADMLKNLGWSVIRVAPDENGIVHADSILEKMQSDTSVVCVMAVNNETGSIQPIADIVDAVEKKCAGKKKPKIHVDAVQAVAKIPLDRFLITGVDTLAVSAHKISGPRGIGLLYMAQRQEPFIRGGAQESGIRSGTENLFGAHALSLCIETYCNSAFFSAAFSEAQERMAYFIRFLHTISSCRIIPSSRTEVDERFSPWIVQVSFEGIPGEVLVRSLSSQGIFISTGSACSSRKNSRPILEAMHITPSVAAQSVRFSQGYTTTMDDISMLCLSLTDICAQFKA